MICRECQGCIDYMGTSVYPYYGLPPHQSFFEVDGRIEVGPSKIAPVETWPDNFQPEQSGDRLSHGVWFCPNVECENSRVKYADKA